MRQTISALLLGAAGFTASFVLERYVTAVPEWAWRIVGLLSVAAGLGGAAISDNGWAYLRSAKPLLLYSAFAIAFALFGLATAGLVIRPLLAISTDVLGFGPVSNVADQPPGTKIGDIPWSTKFSELTLDIVNLTDEPLEDLDVMVRPDEPIAAIDQTTKRPNVVFMVHGDMRIRPEVIDLDSGARVALPMKLIATGAGYHVKCDRLPRQERLGIVIAIASLVGGKGAGDPKNYYDTTGVLTVNTSVGSYSFGYGNDAVFGPRREAKSVHIEASFTRDGQRESQTADLKPISFRIEVSKSVNKS